MWSARQQIRKLALVSEKLFINIEKSPRGSVDIKEFIIPNKQVETQGQESWVEIKPKMREGPIPGKPLQRNPKESFTGYVEKDLKRKDQGPEKEEVIAKDKSVPNSNKITKGPKQS